MRIGLDLGTTTSTLSHLAPNGQIRPGRTLSSLCAWRNGKFLFGEDAHQALRDTGSPCFPIRDIKLSLGEKNVRVGPHLLETEEIVAAFMHDLAIRATGSADVEEAVIGTPVNVPEAHRRALLACAKRAGFKHTRLIYEPTAALAGAVDPGAIDSHSTILVVDWGGGTLDLAVIRKNGDALREIAVDGDVHVLGGSRMDEMLLEKILLQQPDLREKVAAVPGGRDLLKIDIEREKRLVLESLDPESEESEIAPFWLDLSRPLRITGSEVTDVAMVMAEKASEHILGFLSRSRLGTSDITHVLFAGGVCQSDLIRQWIMDKLKDIQLLPTSLPQQLTGYGCARLLSFGFSVQLANHFGVLQSDGSFCQVLPAGQDVSLGAYRRADFMVTDATALEAIFELGLVPGDSASREMLSSNAEGFMSLRTLAVRCQSHVGQMKGGSYDVVRLYAGVSEALSVTVYAESSVGNASASATASAVPMLIRTGPARS